MKRIFKIKDNFGDKFEVFARNQELDPGQVVVFIDDEVPGVILRSHDVKRLRKALKRLAKEAA